MNSENNHYQTLEVSPSASMVVIRAAYRCLVQSHHPDKNAGTDAANDRLAQLNLAYSILSVPVARISYDRSIGVLNSANERRGVGYVGDAGASRHGSRPFGFRPLT